MFNLGRKEKRTFTRTVYLPLRQEVSVLRVKILRPPCNIQAALCPAGMSAGQPWAAQGPPRPVLCVLPSAARGLVLGLAGRSICGFCSRVTVLPPEARKPHMMPSCLALTMLLLSVLSSCFGTFLTIFMVLSVL